MLNEDGFLNLLQSFLQDSENAQILFNCVLIVKNLSLGGVSFLTKIINFGFLPILNDILNKKLDEGLERIQFEASRFIVLIPMIDSLYFCFCSLFVVHFYVY